MRRLESLLRFLCDFIIGDDWRTAMGLVLAISATALVADTNLTSWWILPLAVGALLAYPLWRAAPASR